MTRLNGHLSSAYSIFAIKNHYLRRDVFDKGMKKKLPKQAIVLNRAPIHQHILEFLNTGT